jgi:Ca2+-binding EF-hand superfamily protein
MNIHKIFDLDKCGMVHQVVLARSLHIFDQAVFTPEIVQELVDILDEMHPGRLDGLVTLQSFVELLAQPDQPVRRKRPKLLRRRSTEMLVDALEAYTDSLVADIRGFRDVVKPEAMVDAAGTSPEELAALKASLKEKAKDYVLDAQRKNIVPLWEHFDVNGNGVLDPTECSALVAAYLKTMAGKATDVIRGSVELAAELSILVSEKAIKDDAVKERMRHHAKLQVEAITASVGPLVTKMFTELGNEDPHSVTEDLLSSLDLDKNGKVTRQEFESAFVESMQYVLGPEGLMDKLHKVNSLT